MQDLVEFHSAKEQKLVTLKEYVAAMPESQKHIYFRHRRQRRERLAKIPQTKLLLDRGFDRAAADGAGRRVHPADGQAKYGSNEFRNILTDDLELSTDEEKKAAEEAAEQFKSCVDFMKETLGDRVADVRVSTELGAHPLTMVPDGGMSFEMEKYFKAIGGIRTITAAAFWRSTPSIRRSRRSRTAWSRLREGEEICRAALYAGTDHGNLPLEDPTAYTDLVCGLMQ